MKLETYVCEQCGESIYTAKQLDFVNESSRPERVLCYTCAKNEAMEGEKHAVKK